MIKVHTFVLSLHPTVDGSQKFEDPKHPVFYDQGARCFVSPVPEFITKTIGGAKECSGSTAQKAFDNIYDRYKEYEEKIAPTTRMKIIRYELKLFGARYKFGEDGHIESCDFRHGGYECSESNDQRHLKVEITWDVGWWIKQGPHNWFSHNPDARHGGTFEPDGDHYTGAWMNWTQEREDFFKAMSERMLDLIELISVFFNDRSDLSCKGAAVVAAEVAKKIDSGAILFPRLPTGKPKEIEEKRS